MSMEIPDDIDDRVALARLALHAARHRTEGELTRDAFDGVVTLVDSEFVGGLLGGGSWEDTLSVTGVVYDDSESEPDPPHDETWSDEDLRQALKGAAVAVDGVIRIKDYERWRESMDGNQPTHDTIQRRLGDGSFRAALKAVGLQDRSTLWTANRTRDALKRVDAYKMSTTEYVELSSGDSTLPSLEAVYRHVDSWWGLQGWLEPTGTEHDAAGDSE